MYVYVGLCMCMCMCMCVCVMDRGAFSPGAMNKNERAGKLLEARFAALLPAIYIYIYIQNFVLIFTGGIGWALRAH